MRTLWITLVLTIAACGGTKKAPAAPGESQGSDEATEHDDDTGASDANKPDDPDDMPSKDMDETGNE